jgi:acyl-CoA thioesterase-2
MQPILADLLHLLKLERIEDNIFRGESRDIGSPRVFGGQVLGQALSAASATVVDERQVHSLHAYFLRAGDVEDDIVYIVDIARDGGSFSNRRVVAIQHGKQIFNMTASFQKLEDGLDHQSPMPDVPPPDGLAEMRELTEAMLEAIPEKMHRYYMHERPFEIRPIRPVALLSAEKCEARQCFWFRAVDRLPDDPEVHRYLLAYVSDYQLVATSTLPHGIHFERDRLMLASLDHAMWFHRPFRIDDWLLYSMDSPNASGARGLARGEIFTRDGVLVASTAQEGLIRVLSET